MEQDRRLTDEERATLTQAARNAVQKDAESAPKPQRLPRLVVNAGEIRDLWQHMKNDMPYLMRLAGRTEIEVVAGDPQSGEIGREHADLDEIEVRGTSL
ncbi:hypothetical protein ACFYP4_02330 [Streptomyces sp. NPDC005551]|uniref:hypothetical protein n=1 Tax=Streptomyces sp. NPDC005551 TaxID=3364725 RepID=UPI0036775186